ncbi:uncharacterized protein [Choristoneura fumiferana]|uniref:uncharacterized protein n=1 Tax=Choristoneura fumiferana TaxID=7141 RepID=UPI003D1576A1
MRTPAKRSTEEREERKSPNKPPLDKNVRQSIGEWEAANADATPTLPPTTKQAGPAKSKKPVGQQDCGPSIANKTFVKTPTVTPPKRIFPNRSAEARACLQKAKENLNFSKNIKTEIKEKVIQSLDRLYVLVKEAEAEQKGKLTLEKGEETAEPVKTLAIAPQPQHPNPERLINTLERHAKLLLENTIRVQELQTQIEQHREVMKNAPTATYAEVAANKNQGRSALHSVIVTSADETETGDEVLSKVRQAVDAKEGWVKVEKVRKAKDRKVIMGFGTTEERDKVRRRLETKNASLIVEDVMNKDPLFVLRNVLAINTDEDVLKALRNQNRGVFHDLEGGDDRVTVKYRRKARNPHVTNIVVSTSPKVWQRVTEAGSLHIDLQRVKVEDQSPLVQCTRCLGFGHGRRFCKDSIDACSHCGGPHLRADCPDWVAGIPPKCRNCSKARLENTEHNAFSADCPIKIKWDVLARSAVAYC